MAAVIEKGNKITLTNGTVTSTADSGVKMLVQNYCDLTLNGIENSVQPGLVVDQFMIEKTYGDEPFTPTVSGGANGKTLTYSIYRSWTWVQCIDHLHQSR